MKRIYTILSCLLLAGMLCIGLYALLDKDATYSESERRKLKTRPKLTFSAMLDGSYASDYRDYFADTFPNREKLMNANRSLNGFYYFSGGSKDGAQLVINMNGGAANHGEALPSTDDDDALVLDPAQRDERDCHRLHRADGADSAHPDAGSRRCCRGARLRARRGRPRHGGPLWRQGHHPLLCRCGERHCCEAWQQRAHVLHRRAESRPRSTPRRRTSTCCRRT